MSISHAYVAVTNDLNQDQRMHRICITLQDLGYDVTLVGRRKKNSEPLYNQVFGQHRLSMIFQSGVLFYVEYQIRLFYYLLFSSSPKLMYSVDLDTALPVKIAAWLRRSLSIHDAHELFTEVPELIASPIKRRIWSLVGEMTMKGYDHRFTVNESLAHILAETYGCEFIPVRNLPMTKERSTKKLIYARPYIWYQGVLNEGRGLEEVIFAMSSLPDLDLRIAGEGDRSLALRLLADNSVAHERIHFQGWMNPNDMHDWASNAWIGINLLDDSAGNYYHSLANRTFDYIQAELPALHMDFPEYRVVVEKYGIGELLSELSDKLIVKTIIDLQQDSVRYDYMKRSCITAKGSLAWEKECEKIIEVLNLV